MTTDADLTKDTDFEGITKLHRYASHGACCCAFGSVVCLSICRSVTVC